MFPPPYTPPPSMQHVETVAAPAAAPDEFALIPEKKGDFIGQASQLPDGTIILDVDDRYVNGSVLHNRLAYAPSSPDYKAALAKYGPFTPGKKNPVLADGPR